MTNEEEKRVKDFREVIKKLFLKILTLLEEEAASKLSGLAASLNVAACAAGGLDVSAEEFADWARQAYVCVNGGAECPTK